MHYSTLIIVSCIRTEHAATGRQNKITVERFAMKVIRLRQKVCIRTCIVLYVRRRLACVSDTGLFAYVLSERPRDTHMHRYLIDVVALQGLVHTTTVSMHRVHCMCTAGWAVQSWGAGRAVCALQIYP